MNRVASSELRVARTKFRTRSPLLETRKLVTYMNWLYPNFLRKIDHYLKINYRHIWRTRVHDFAWFSLVLGNLFAAALGVFVVGYDNVLSGESVTILHSGFAVMLGFVVLFWARRLSRLKMGVSNFEAMLTTWVIYVLCVASLGLNLATFTSSIAYQTTRIYSDELVQADYAYMGTNFNFNKDHKYVPYEEGNHLREDHLTEELIAIMSRHGDGYYAGLKIYMPDIEAVRGRIDMLNEAQFFVQQPFLEKDFNHFSNQAKKGFYRELLGMSWFALMLALLFLPTLLFLLSEFGVRNLMVSALITSIIFALIFIPTKMDRGTYYFTGLVTIPYIFVTFILGITLNRYRRSWNYMAGVFMLMLAVVFFVFYVDAVQGWIRLIISPLWIIDNVLLFSLLASLIAAWHIAKRNGQPVLQ